MYETYDFREPAYVGYNSVAQTVPSDRENRISGGKNGLLELKCCGSPTK